MLLFVIRWLSTKERGGERRTLYSSDRWSRVELYSFLSGHRLAGFRISVGTLLQDVGTYTESSKC